MRNYKPRRQSARWLNEDCPKGVLAIYDHPAYAERYTVFYTDPICGTSYADTIIGFRGMSVNPSHPQGIGLFGEMGAHETAQFRYASRNRAARWSDLPEAVKACVRRDLAE
jgi:hypothetical protein